MANKPYRPVFLDLRHIRLPVTALTSIAHRLFGLLMFIALPFLLYVLELSLRDPAGFERAGALLTGWPAKLGMILLLWGLGHHLLAGIRLLLTDLDIGSRLPWARRGAWWVNVGGFGVAVAGAFVIL